MGNKLYKPKNKRKKENLKMIDRLEISGVTIAAIALLGWSGYSIRIKEYYQHKQKLQVF